MKGFVKLPRDFDEWEWWGRVPHHFLFEWLLMHAEVRDRKIQGVLVRRGSVLTTWSEMQTAVSRHEKCSRGTLSRAIRDFSECGEIITRTDCHKTLVTICHYEDYNGYTGALWTTSGLPADYQRTSTPLINKEIKNEEYNIYNSAREGFDNDSGFVTESDCRLWMRRYCEIARRFGVPDRDLPVQLNAKRQLKIRMCVGERGRGAVDIMFSRLAESAYYFHDGSNGFRGDFTKLWSPSVFDMVLEGSFIPSAKKKEEQNQKEQKPIGLFESTAPQLPQRQSGEEYRQQMRLYAQQHPESPAAKVVAAWNEEEQKQTSIK